MHVENHKWRDIFIVSVRLRIMSVFLKKGKVTHCNTQTYDHIPHFSSGFPVYSSSSSGAVVNVSSYLITPSSSSSPSSYSD